MASSPPDTRASLILRLPNSADVAAWDEFIAIYGSLVFRLARRQGLQPADAEDLVQEVFMAVARSVSQWIERDDRGAFRAWLLRIARNVAVNFLIRRPYRSIGMGDEDMDNLISQMAKPDEEMSRQFDLEYRREVFRWAAEQVKQTVAHSTWQAFWLTHVEEHSIAEVAEQLGVSVGHIYIGRSRVMSRLRELIKEHESIE